MRLKKIYFFFPEVALKIYPLIGSSKKYGQTPLDVSSVLDKLRELFLKEGDKSANITRLRCYDYILLENKKSCSYVTIICKLLNKSDVRNFEKYCNSKEFVENLKTYFMRVYKEFGFQPYSGTTSQLRFHVTVAEKSVEYPIPQSTGPHNSLRFDCFLRHLYIV